MSDHGIPNVSDDELPALPEQSAPPAVPESPRSPAVPAWYLAAIGMNHRPATVEELRDLLVREQAAPEAEDRRTYLVWTGEMWSWEPLESLPDLLKSLTDQEPPSPPETKKGSLFERILASMVSTVEEAWKNFQMRLQRKNFVGQIWWFVLLQLIPLIGSVINKGWRLDLMRTKQEDRWPDRRHIGRHFAEGMFLWAMYLIYLLPQFFLLALIGFDWVEDAVNLAWWAAQNLTTGSSTQTFQEILGGSVVTFVLDSLVLAVYPIAAWPFYRAAMIRYAFSGQAKAFWQLLENWRFVDANADVLLGLYVPQKVLWLLCLFLGAMLLSTGLLAPVIPLALAPSRLTLSGLLYRKAMKKAFPLAQFFSEPRG